MTTPKASVERYCPDCGGVVSYKANRCKRCHMRSMALSPDRGAKISAAHKARLKDPEVYARHCEAARRAGATKSADPVFCAKAAQRMREHIQPLSHTPEALARRDNSITGKRSGETKMAWCPPAYLAEYRHLTKTKKLKKADAQRIIFAQVEADRLRKATPLKLSPFERQERALNSGARIVANDRHDIHSPAVAELRAKLG